MTPDNFEFDFSHLAPLEPAARILCGMDQQDPDEQMDAPHPVLAGIKLSRPAWHFAAEYLLQLTKGLAALKQAATLAAAAPAKDPRQGGLFPTEH